MTPENTLDPKRFSKAAASGLRVFPIRARDKRPACNWTDYKEVPATTAELMSWDKSNYNVGIICGDASGIVVIDVDSPEAQDFVDKLNLPLTPCAKTSKGRHYYFEYPPSGLGNGVRINGVQIDVRGDGGFVVGAGSIHQSGDRYQWLVSPDDADFAPMPENLREFLSSSKANSAHSSRAAMPRSKVRVSSDGPATKFDRYLDARLVEACDELRKAEIGARNDTLFRAGARLANDVAGAGADWAKYSPKLRELAIKIGLEEAETDNTLASCWNAGSDCPTEWMNVARNWVYLSKPEMFYHLESREMINTTAFNSANLRHWPGKGKLSNFLLSKDLIEEAHSLTYAPESDEGFIRLDGLRWLNTYKPSDVVEMEGDSGPFADFVTYLVPDDGDRAHLLKMIAWTIRNPGKKLRHALLLRSEAQGIGKSMLIEIWANLLGASNVRRTTTEEMSSQYQGFIKETLLVVLEELNWGFGPSGYNRLKELITGDIASVNEKYMPIKHWPNHATFAILTNVKTPMAIERNDRRIFFIDSPAKPRERDYYRNFATWWKANLSVIRHSLNDIDLSDFNPHAPPPMTDAKRALIDDSRPGLVRDLAALIEERAGVFRRDLVTLTEIEDALGSSMRGKTAGQLREALSDLGAVSFGQKRVKGTWIGESFVNAPNKRASLWAIRNPRYWLAVDDAGRAEEYAKLDSGLPTFLRVSMEWLHASDWPGGEDAFMGNFT